AFTTPPSSTAQSGVALAQQPVLQLKDANDNPVSQSGVVVTATVSPAGAAPSNATATTGSNGSATFSGLTLTGTAGSYTLSFGATGLTPATAGITLSAGAASKLALSTPPSSSAQSGVAFSQQPVVQVQDASGNPVSQSGDLVTATVASGPAGATLTNATATTGPTGAAPFSGLAISGPTGTYTLSFGASGLTAVTSGSINLAAGPAAQVAFTVQPTSTTAGTIITPAVRVTVQDAFGNRVTSFPGGRPNVTVAIGNNPGGDTLSGDKSNLTGTGGNAGIATFNSLSIAKAGQGYTLTAAATGLTGGVSTDFTITPKAAKLLVFTVQPSAEAAGAVITPAVQVTARDSLGNTATSFSGTVTVAIGTNPSGGVLSGTTNPSAVNGVATFADLRIDKAGAGYTLTAAATGLTGSNSTAFTISAGAATKLVLTTQPSTSAQSGVALAQQPVVQLQDANSNPVSEANGVVTATVATGPAGATLSNATATTGTSGAAAFSGLAISGAPGSYTLTFGASELTPATSGTITLGAGTATQLTITAEPSPTASSGTAFNQQPVIQVRDAVGNPAGGAGVQVTAVIASGPAGATLSNASATTLASGAATFNGLAINGAAGDYTLRFESGSLSPATSSTITLSAAATATTITSDQPDPSVVAQGIEVRFTVTSAGGTPAGDVTVTDGTVNCVTTVAAGTCTLTPLTPGDKLLTAAYAGNETFGPSTSPPEPH